MPATPSPSTVCINLQEIWCRSEILSVSSPNEPKSVSYRYVKLHMSKLLRIVVYTIPSFPYSSNHSNDLEMGLLFVLTRTLVFCSVEWIRRIGNPGAAALYPPHWKVRAGGQYLLRNFVLRSSQVVIEPDGDLDSSRLSVLRSFQDDRNSRSGSLKGVNGSLVELLVMHYLKQGINNQEEKRDEKKRLNHLKQDQTMLVLKRFSERKKVFRERKKTGKIHAKRDGYSRKDKKKAKNKQNRVRDGKDKVKSKPKSVKVKKSTGKSTPKKSKVK
ncbi:hypothetical protein Tco_0992428 [Tanacetum coccineum]|uniref:Uncharacterized protein n=1 Tax=Tanacetum coccineum TaxID=301880 RepID=A0ABQ5F2J3_9ASTR